MPDTASRDGPRLLVLGYDGSAASSNALAYAVGMARRESSHVVIVEVSAVISYGTPIFGASGVANL